MLPTVERPLYLTLYGSIPSMKNQRTPFLGRSRDGVPYVGIRKNTQTARRMAELGAFLLSQFERSGFEPIPMPHRVGVYARIYKQQPLSAPVPRSDLDNQYTTLQELLQMVGVLEDDRQVAAYCVEERLVQHRQAERAELSIFLVDKQVPFVVQLERVVSSVPQFDHSVRTLPNILQ